MERLMNQSLTVKISVFIYLIVIILFLFLSLFLFGIVGRASERRLSEEHSKLLRVAILMINSRQQYMIGVADYYALSPDIKNMMDTSNSGLPVTTILDESRFKTPTIIILSSTMPKARLSIILQRIPPGCQSIKKTTMPSRSWHQDKPPMYGTILTTITVIL